MSKYHSRPTTVDGIRFHSAAEARRYRQLRLLEAAGEIADLELQPAYPVRVEGKHICIYRADFCYRDLSTGKTVVEDVKGYRTALYRLKKRLVEVLYHITITEVPA